MGLARWTESDGAVGTELGDMVELAAFSTALATADRQPQPSLAPAEVYLDHTGAALYPERLLHEHVRILKREVFGNPHSTHPASQRSTRSAQAARDALLGFLDADPADYEVVWTANASSALRLVGESFPFAPDVPLVLTADNHNAVHGIREHARRRGAPTHYLPLDAELRARPFALPAVPGGLFAYPAQSNFTGVQHPLSWVERAQRRGYRVLLDAAAFLPTHPLSLRKVPADFLTLSLYKMCGYPTGLGALVARRDALSELVRPTFSGGTVEFVSVMTDRYLLKEGAEAFEDGTGSFLAWSAVPLGLDFLQSQGLPAIGAHVSALTGRMLMGMKALRHANGTPVVQIYGPKDVLRRGGTIAFNVADADQKVLDHEHVVESAAERGICLRGGCFCNPGAAEHAFGYSAPELGAALDRLGRDFSMPAMRVALGGKPVGAVRASLGYGSKPDDVDALLGFLRGFAASA
jgi:selenocysteine lyase/cysteine desulfurase